MDTVEVFRDSKGEYRWHRKSENGRIVSDSGEGYADKGHTLRMAAELNEDAEIEDLT